VLKPLSAFVALLSLLLLYSFLTRLGARATLCSPSIWNQLIRAKCLEYDL
jgi:hypothetical protein